MSKIVIIDENNVHTNGLGSLKSLFQEKMKALNCNVSFDDDSNEAASSSTSSASDGDANPRLGFGVHAELGFLRESDQSDVHLSKSVDIITLGVRNAFNKEDVLGLQVELKGWCKSHIEADTGLWCAKFTLQAQ